MATLLLGALAFALGLALALVRYRGRARTHLAGRLAREAELRVAAEAMRCHAAQAQHPPEK